MRKKLMTLFLTGPSLLWLILFLAVPVVTIVIVGFWQVSIGGLKPGFTLESYNLVFSSGANLRILLNTFKLSGITIAISLLIGFPVAHFLTFHVKTLRMKIVLFLIALTPFWTNYLIRSATWLSMLGRRGVINMTLMQIGLIEQPLDSLAFGQTSIIVAFVQLYSLFMMAPIFFLLSSIDESTIEAARDMGASTIQVFKEVIFPLSVPGIVIGTILVFVTTMGDFATVQIVGGGKHGSIGLVMRNLINYTQYSPSAAVGVVFVVVMLISLVILTRFSDLMREL